MADAIVTRDQVVKRIESFYAELGDYPLPGSLDLLTHGIPAFLKEIDLLRERGDRVLSMKRQVSEWRSMVRPISSARKRFFERQVTQHLGENEFRKGLDAKERRALAESHFSEQEDDANAWFELERSLGDLYNDLTDKYKSFVDAKYDLRANLASLRLQLILERSGQDLRSLLTEDNLKKTARSIDNMQAQVAPDSLGGANDPVLTIDPKELDALLGGSDGSLM